MLNKKAYMITPLIFVVFMIIAVIFSFYVSDIDKKNAEGIRSAGMIDKGILEIQKEQINQVNFVKLVTYDCSKTICCNSTNLGNLENCIEQELETIYGGIWSVDINNCNEIGFELSSFSATNINMASNKEYVWITLSDKIRVC